MQTERLPIERFIYQKIQTPKMKKVLEPLAIDPEVVARSLVKVFVDMGVFMVQPGQEGPIEQAMLAEIGRIVERQKARPPQPMRVTKHSA